MTNPDSFLVVVKFFSMFAMFGLIKFAANEASTKSAERIRATRKKKTAGKRSNVRAKPTLIGGSVLKASPKAKTKARRLKSKPLSFEDQRRVDDYFIRKYNIVSFSNIPL